MPMPMQIAHATDEFNSFLADAGKELDLVTRNQVYTTVQSVLVVFRRRLSAEQILIFAQVFPPVLKAIFIDGWQPDEQISSFGARQDWISEVKDIRKHHNFSPDNAIEIVAQCIWSIVETEAFTAALHAIGPEAEAYWNADV